MVLTKAQKEKYLEKGGIRCPHCGSGDLNTRVKPRTNSCGQITQDIQCFGCGEFWTDIYTLSGIAE